VDIRTTKGSSNATQKKISFIDARPKMRLTKMNTSSKGSELVHTFCGISSFLKLNSAKSSFFIFLFIVFFSLNPNFIKSKVNLK